MPKWPFIEPKFERIARFGTVIGVILGGIQSLTWIILSNNEWPILAKILICLAMGMLLTGGLHIDGLMDTADGLAAKPSKCLEAMKDSRVGAIGVQSLIFIFLIQIGAILKIGENAIFAFPIASFWGRFSQIWAIEKYTYLSQKKLSFHHQYWKGIKKEITPSIATLVIIILIAISLNQTLLVIATILLGLIPCIITTYTLQKKIGGHNGDTYGASLVIVETMQFIIFAILWAPK